MAPVWGYSGLRVTVDIHISSSPCMFGEHFVFTVNDSEGTRSKASEAVLCSLQFVPWNFSISCFKHAHPFHHDYPGQLLVRKNGTVLFFKPLSWNLPFEAETDLMGKKEKIVLHMKKNVFSRTGVAHPLGKIGKSPKCLNWLTSTY